MPSPDIGVGTWLSVYVSGITATAQENPPSDLSISEIASGLKWATGLVVDGALEAVNSELRPAERWS
jgi:hypothetical protein